MSVAIYGFDLDFGADSLVNITAGVQRLIYCVPKKPDP